MAHKDPGCSGARIRIALYLYTFLDLGVKPIEARRDRGCRSRAWILRPLAALVSRLDHVAPAITKVAGHFHVAPTRRTRCLSSPLAHSFTLHRHAVFTVSRRQRRRVPAVYYLPRIISRSSSSLPSLGDSIFFPFLFLLISHSKFRIGWFLSPGR